MATGEECFTSKSSVFISVINAGKVMARSMLTDRKDTRDNGFEPMAACLWADREEDGNMDYSKLIGSVTCANAWIMEASRFESAADLLEALEDAGEKCLDRKAGTR
jgi:hypothetical protein